MSCAHGTDDPQMFAGAVPFRFRFPCAEPGCFPWKTWNVIDGPSGAGVLRQFERVEAGDGRWHWAEVPTRELSPAEKCAAHVDDAYRHVRRGYSSLLGIMPRTSAQVGSDAQEAIRVATAACREAFLALGRARRALAALALALLAAIGCAGETPLPLQSCAELVASIEHCPGDTGLLMCWDGAGNSLAGCRIWYGTDATEDQCVRMCDEAEAP